jgi:hypothetical protein
MSDPTQPAPADPAAPAVQPPAAPSVATQPPASPPPPVVAPRVLNPYAAMPSRPAAPAAVAPPTEAPAPTAPAADPRIDGLMAALRESVGEQLAGISEGARKTVLDLAGDDPIAQRRVLATLRANGVTGPVTLPPGASTAVPSGQPAPAPVASPDVDALSRWTSLREKGAHITAAAFRATHGAAIDRALAARGSN